MMNVENILWYGVRQQNGASNAPYGGLDRSPGFSRWMPAGSAAYCQASLSRLKPGLLKIDIRIKHHL
jgi:hypothetical protein